MKSPGWRFPIAKPKTAMLTREQKIILGKLGYYIAFFASALPARSIPTFCELLVANMVTSEGFVTRSWICANSITSGGVTISGSKKDAGRPITSSPASCSFVAWAFWKHCHCFWLLMIVSSSAFPKKLWGCTDCLSTCLQTQPGSLRSRAVFCLHESDL